MKLKLFVGAALCAAACVALSGCSTVGQQAFLQDIQTCSRHYNGSVSAGVVGGGNFSGSVKIDCDPVGKPLAPAVAAAATSAQ